MEQPWQTVRRKPGRSAASSRVPPRTSPREQPVFPVHTPLGPAEFADEEDYDARDDEIVVRSGVLPIFLEGNSEYWVMSRSRWTNKLGDFGGGCLSNEKHDARQCMTRELGEEASEQVRDLVLNSLDWAGGVTYDLGYIETCRGRPREVRIEETLEPLFLRQPAGRGKNKGMSWLAVVPVDVTYIELLSARPEFKMAAEAKGGAGEVLSIEVVEFEKVERMSDRQLQASFDPTIIDFIRVLIKQ